MHTINELEKIIQHNNDLYWNGKELEISDIEYDCYVRELEKLDPENSLVTEIAIPHLIGEKLITHKKPMLSLGKVYSLDELMKWVNKVSRSEREEFKIQPKYDGMSGKLECGKLSSRGDGIHGQDYTDKLSLINFDTNKKHIDIKKDFLLGEILIKNSTFKDMYNNGKGMGKVVAKSGKLFKNQRNGIAGIIGTDDTDFYKSQGAVITMVDYDLESWHVSKKDFAERWEEVVKIILTTTDYPLDGIVIKLADKEYSESLGYTTHHPRGQVAFKFTNQQRESKLIDVIWGMGKEQLSIVGVIEPVEISGVIIKQAKLQLTKPKSSDVTTYVLDGSLQIGDKVIVERAGDIIPHIVSSIPGENRKRIHIDVCPFCGGQLKINESSIECTNPDCIERIIQNIYCSIVTLGFKNIGIAFIRDLVTKLNVKTLNELLQIKLDSLQDKCFGAKTKITFLNEVKKSLNETDRGTFLAALNIPTVGVKIGHIITDNFTFNELLNPNKELINKMRAVNGLGDTIIKTTLQFILTHKITIKEMISLFKFKEAEKVNESGDTICFTGKMEMKRSEMEAIAKERRLVPIDHVDKTLKILVCADPNSGSSKLQKASKLGIRIVSEKDFVANNY